MSTRAYRGRVRTKRSDETRRKITDAVAALMAEGAFHLSTVDQVADRAGVARATLYQHFPSRLDLVDVMCERFDENPALLRIRDVVELDDPVDALSQTILNTSRFWSTEDPILSQIYGVVAIDPAAQDLVDRQRADRRGEMTRLARHLKGAGLLRDGLTERRALSLLMVITSYETFCELRLGGLSQENLVKTLQESAGNLLLGG